MVCGDMLERVGCKGKGGMRGIEDGPACMHA